MGRNFLTLALASSHEEKLLEFMPNEPWRTGIGSMVLTVEYMGLLAGTRFITERQLRASFSPHTTTT
jgi:hypothetical protein